MRLFFTFLLLMIVANLSAQNENISNGMIFEGEPYIAMNPNDNQHLVAAWMGFKLGQKIIIKTRATFDGGETWSTTAELPHIETDYGSADPSLQIDNNGNVYLCYIDFDNVNHSAGKIVVAKSTDGGTSWSAPVDAISTTDCPDQLCIDRPWMVVDNSGGSLDGTVYVTSMNANQPSIVIPPYHPYFVTSTDGGATFSTPRHLDTTDYLAGDNIPVPMPTPAVSADGVFYAVYPSYETSQSVFAQYIMASSTDAGVSLNHTVIQQQSSGLSSSDAKKAPLLISNPSDASHLGYIQLGEENGDLDVYFSESFDYGNTWSSMERVNDDPIGNNVMQDLVWGDFNENNDLVISWRDRRNGGTGYNVPTEIMGAVRFNDSSNFSTNFLITDTIADHDTVVEGSGNDFMSIEFSGDTIHAVWGDVRSGVLNIYYNKMNVRDQTSSIKSIANSDWNFDLIYPNPATNYVTFENNKKGVQYQIITKLGRIAQEGVVSSNNNINVSELPKGEYFLYLTNNASFSTYKMQKK
ncbi:MAG: T9SS type A sorting domain-containing protein [Brumimicrobium sp.]